LARYRSNRSPRGWPLSAQAGDTVDGRAAGERILAGDIDLQFLLCGEARLELIEVRAAGFGMP
jgi:hypothetical protein